jgi:hypothetical protein
MTTAGYVPVEAQPIFVRRMSRLLHRAEVFGVAGIATALCEHSRPENERCWPIEPTCLSTSYYHAASLAVASRGPAHRKRGDNNLRRNGAPYPQGTCRRVATLASAPAPRARSSADGVRLNPST